MQSCWFTNLAGDDGVPFFGRRFEVELRLGLAGREERGRLKKKKQHSASIRRMILVPVVASSPTDLAPSVGTVTVTLLALYSCNFFSPQEPSLNYLLSHNSARALFPLATTTPLPFAVSVAIVGRVGLVFGSPKARSRRMIAAIGRRGWRPSRPSCRFLPQGWRNARLGEGTAPP